MTIEKNTEERQEQAETLHAIKQCKRHKNKTSALEVLRDIKENGARRFRGTLIDHFTASAILAVYNALNDQNKEKYGAVIESNLLKASSIAFKLCK